MGFVHAPFNFRKNVCRGGANFYFAHTKTLTCYGPGPGPMFAYLKKYMSNEMGLGGPWQGENGLGRGN